jgi:hypothetical protein
MHSVGSGSAAREPRTAAGMLESDPDLEAYLQVAITEGQVGGEDEDEDEEGDECGDGGTQVNATAAGAAGVGEGLEDGAGDEDDDLDLDNYINELSADVEVSKKGAQGGGWCV